MRVRRAALPLIGLAALLAAGCGATSSGDDASGGGNQVANPAEPAPEAAAARGEDTDGAAADAGGTGGGTLIDPRAIIYTGSITVRVPDVDAAASQTIALADRYGGFVSGDERNEAPESARAVIVLRIPSERFTAAVDELGGLGEEEARSVNTEDVTQEVVDVEARIETARASVARVRALLEEAESLTDVVAIEAELSTREADLASLEARQRTLTDLTTLSTITARLLSPHAPEPETESDTGVLAGLRDGWDGFLTAMGALLTAVGWLLPWLVLFGVPTAGALWWNRRRRATRPATAAPLPSDPAQG